MNESIGEKLKNARIQKGLGQSELAKHLKVTDTTISDWENNISKPNLEMLTYLCEVLDIKPSYLIKD